VHHIQVRRLTVSTSDVLDVRDHGDTMSTLLQGIKEFSHLAVTWRFHLASPDDVALHARSPRNNPDWLATGTFVHRNH